METCQENLTDGPGLFHNYIQGRDPQHHEHMCHSVMAGWLIARLLTEQVCPLPRAQKANVPAQFLLFQGVSFPFSSPSTQDVQVPHPLLQGFQ